MSPSSVTSQRLRYWAGPTAAILVSLTLLFLPLESKRRTAEILERSLFYPFRAAVGWGPRSLEMAREMERLKEAKTTDRLSEDRILETTEENRRLRRLLGFELRSEAELLPAVVFGRQRGRMGDVLTVHSRNPERVEPGRPVLVPEGLLGSVLSVSGGQIRVECLTNRKATVSVINQRSREEGILRWSLKPRGGLVIWEVPIQADWRPGDRVITSGLGTIFPRGLLVGWVTELQREQSGPLRRVYVRPAASPAQAEEVFILLASDPSDLEQEESDSSLYPSDISTPRSELEPDRVTPGPQPVP